MSANLFGNFLTVGTLPLLVLLIIIYYSKNQFNSARIKLFKFLLFLSLSVSATEILMALSINYDFHIILKELISRIHFTGEVMWWGVFVLYNYALFESISSNKIIDVIKYNKSTKFIAILYLIIIVLVCSIPQISTVDGVDINKIEYFPLRQVYIPSILVTGIEFVTAIRYLIKSKGNKEFQDDRYMLYAVITILIVFYIFQGIFPYISFSCLAFAFFLYMMYFLNENPDLAVIRETDNTQKNIEMSNKVKTDFLSNMSYEIKMPMNLIVSLCDEVNNIQNYNEENAKRYVRSIVQYGNDLIDIVNNVLDISKIESGSLTLSETDYNINELLINIINIAKQKIGSKPIQLVVNINENTSSILHGDSSKLYQALLNIVTNAIKYTEVGKVTIDLISSKNNNNEHLIFKVSDTGIGIKDEDKEKIFLKGSKITNDLGNEDEGSGLGLAITKQYIETMGGSISFDSEFRVGTTFVVELDQKIIDATPIGNMKNTNENGVKSLLDCSNYKVLIVDDNLLNIKVARRLLEKYKFNIEDLTSGIECIDKIKEEEHYDIIFIDHVMPEIDGIETLKVLKSLQGYKLPPIIALTANAIVGMKEMYLKEGFDDYLSKPIDTHELDRIINKYFGQKNVK